MVLSIFVISILKRYIVLMMYTNYLLILLSCRKMGTIRISQEWEAIAILVCSRVVACDNLAYCNNNSMWFSLQYIYIYIYITYIPP